MNFSSEKRSVKNCYDVVVKIESERDHRNGLNIGTTIPEVRLLALKDNFQETLQSYDTK